MNSLFINGDEEDSDSDFDPYKLQMEDTQPDNNTPNITKNNNINNDTQHNENSNQNKSNHKKRGRPKSKRRKKKSNHIDTSSKHKNREDSEELKERLCSVDKYDTQQYIESVTDAIHNGRYLHPFINKPSSLPKRRISKIMKLDPTSFKISCITLELMAILIEMFIRDLISRSYKYTIKDNRKSLQLQDICRTVQSDHMYDFLIDIVPRIQSYDQQSNAYNFIYVSQMENCVLMNKKVEEKRMNIDDKNENESDGENRLAIRRSKRIKSKRSDKEEAD